LPANSQSLANQRYQFAAPVEAAELELAAVGKYEPGAGEQVADGGRDEDFARLRYAENACGGMDRDPSYLVTLKLDLTRVDRGASGKAMGGGGIDHCRRTPHGTRRTGKQDEEAVSCGLRLAAAEALDLAAHSLVVFSEQQAPSEPHKSVKTAVVKMRSEISCGDFAKSRRPAQSIETDGSSPTTHAS
jgi:hypothetical protein